MRLLLAWIEKLGPAWMPPDGALHGFALDRLMKINLLLVCSALLLSHLVLAAAIFRRGRGKTRPVVLVLDGIALALVVLIFVWMAAGSQALWAASRFAGASPQAMRVEVDGAQFQWYFRYPGKDGAFGNTRPELVDPAGGNPLGIDPRDPASRDDVVSSQLLLPLGREADLLLRSQDVIHSFAIAGMRVRQDAVPGMLVHIHFTPVRPGNYPIVCTQLCGLGHERMQARLRVVSQQEYAAWLKDGQKALPVQAGAR